MKMILLTKFRLSLIIFLTIVTFWICSDVVLANQASTEIEKQCAGYGADSAFCSGYNSNSGNPIVNVIKAATDLLAFIAGFLAIIFVLWGGFSYITASGDSNKVSSAKNKILFALIGLVVVILARTLIQYVLGKIN